MDIPGLAQTIDTGGGAYIGGSVNTGSVTFVGRDQHITAGERGVAVGGNITGSTITTGDNNTLQRGKYNVNVEHAQGLAIGDRAQAHTTTAEPGAQLAHIQQDPAAWRLFETLKRS